MPDVAAKFIYRKATAAEWTASNPILANGEPGYVTDSKQFKIGDGVTAFDSLQFYPNATALNAAVTTANAASVSAAAALTAANSANAAAAAANATANAALAAITGSSVGAIVYFAGNYAPGGFIKANGALLSRTTYAALWVYAQASGAFLPEATKISLTRWAWWGSGNGTTTFSIPDLRGFNLMSWDDGRGADPGRVILDYQAAMVRSHGHGITQTAHAHSVSDPGHNHSVYDPAHAHGVSDPGHSHGFTETGGNGGFGGGEAYDPGSAQLRSFNRATAGSGTGIGVAAAYTGVLLYASGAGVSVNPATIPIFVNTGGDGPDNRIQSLAALACIKY